MSIGKEGRSSTRVLTSLASTPGPTCTRTRFRRVRTHQKVRQTPRDMKEALAELEEKR